MYSPQIQEQTKLTCSVDQLISSSLFKTKLTFSELERRVTPGWRRRLAEREKVFSGHRRGRERDSGAAAVSGIKLASSGSDVLACQADW